MSLIGITVECKNCGKEFKRSNHNRVYCSKECFINYNTYKRKVYRKSVIDLAGEIWETTDEYPGYAFSSFGRVKALEKVWVTGRNKSCISKKEHILKLSINNDGYYHVSMRRNGKGVTKQIHRIIAKLFIPNPKNKSQVNHIDGNKLNNNIHNLEWVTPKENAIHSWICEGIRNKPYAKRVPLTDEEKTIIKDKYFSGISIRKISIKLKRDYSTIQAYISKYLKEDKFVVSIKGYAIKEIKMLYNRYFELSEDHKVSKGDLDTWMSNIIQRKLYDLKKID